MHALDHRGHGKIRRQAHVRQDRTTSSSATSRAVPAAGRAASTPDCRSCVLGHSMGGNLAVGHVLDHQAGVRALALSAPALESRREPVAEQDQAGHARSARSHPGCDAEALSADAISRDPAVVAAYRSRPARVHRQGHGRARRGADRRACSASRRAMPSSGSRSSCSTAPPISSPTSPARASSRRARSTPRSRPTTTTGCTTRSSTSRSRQTVLADTVAWLDSVTG